MNVRIRSLYLCVTDMDRAIDFYEKFLERPVLKRDEVYSVFEADGFRLGLFAFQKAGEGYVFGSGWCEIVDFGVLEKYRRRGIGTALMDCAEKISGTFADTVYLAVGLHDGYGSAQRMYCKRGYIPDGSGVWYHNAPAEAYGQVCNDDELNLYFSKRLR